MQNTSEVVCELDKELGVITYVLPVKKGGNKEKAIKRAREFLKSASVTFKIVEKLSEEQRKFIWVIMEEYGKYFGYKTEEIKVELVAIFCEEREIKKFSLSQDSKIAATMELATEFIGFIIEHAVDNGIDLSVYWGRGEHRKLIKARDLTEDIERQMRAAIYNKRCAVCGRDTENQDGLSIELHHWYSVSSIGGRDNCTGLQVPFMTLCKEHHDMIHGQMSREQFCKAFVVQPIWMNEKMIRKLLSVYPGHFPKFRRMMADGEI